MENFDKNKIEKIITTRKQAHAFYSRKSSTYRSFVEMAWGPATASARFAM